MSTQPGKNIDVNLEKFIGTWKIRNGEKVIISGHCVTTIEGNLFVGWIGQLNGMISYWDEAGNHFKYRMFDLIEKGRGPNNDDFTPFKHK